ncbi:SI1L3 protein, partial [Indicator maculatus]|nr:SI1L3 protein [Indicator maculatus]
MGVRARIAEWPPKRDPPGREGNPTPPGGHPSTSSFKALQRFARRRSKEVEFQEGWGRSPLGAPLRQRSSSEVTLSECDPEEVPAEPGGTGGGGPGAGGCAGGSGLYREYGSTSSIDVQGVSEQSFFEMLNELRAKRPPREAGSKQGEVRNGCREDPSPPPAKEKQRRRCPRAGEGGGESIFKKLRSSGREAGEDPKPPGPQQAEAGKPWLCQKSFAHYDVQSLLFDLNLVATNRAVVAQRKNTTTGASAASVATASSRARGVEGTTGATTTTSGGGGGPGGAFNPLDLSSGEELSWKEDLEEDLGDNTSNELLLSCPHFRNEIGGAAQRDLSFSRSSSSSSSAPQGPPGGFSELPNAFRPTNAGISVLEVAKELQRNPSRLRHHSVEHVDLGARYYRDHFHGKEHSNYFGLDERLGPVAVSIKRE